MPKLTLELPDETYRRLSTDAQRHGRSVEEEAQAVVLDRFPISEQAESREELLRRIRERWKEMPESPPVSPEEMKEWINYGRP